jgi:hypothetical protein
VGKARLPGERAAPGIVSPVPVRLTLCGLPAALSVTVTSAYRDPLAVGEKVAVMVQELPAASELPQLLVSLKSWMLTPVIPMLEMVMVALPVLLSVML